MYCSHQITVISIPLTKKKLVSLKSIFQALSIGTHRIKISHLRAQAVMSKDSKVVDEIRVRGYARSFSSAHSQKITRGHNI